MASRGCRWPRGVADGLVGSSVASKGQRWPWEAVGGLGMFLVALGGYERVQGVTGDLRGLRVARRGVWSAERCRGGPVGTMRSCMGHRVQLVYGAM
jgi:hypothetical protein